MKKHHVIALALLSLLGIYLLGGRLVANANFYIPENQKDITALLEQPTRTDVDYETLYLQTGLAKPMIQILEKETDFKERMLAYQANYFKKTNVVKTNMNILTRVDQIHSDKGEWISGFELAPYENGYIFLSKSTYTANWRHGHAGLVVDAKRGILLESLEPFTKSTLQNANKWTYYPTFKMMRLRDVPQETNEQIAAYALENLQDLPYNILAMKNFHKAPKSTHCSHIVWSAFIPFGYDLDSSRGIFISPEDIANSSLLETLQVFGFDPKGGW